VKHDSPVEPMLSKSHNENTVVMSCDAQGDLVNFGLSSEIHHNKQSTSVDEASAHGYNVVPSNPS